LKLLESFVGLVVLVIKKHNKGDDHKRDYPRYYQSSARFMPAAMRTIPRLVAYLFSTFWTGGECHGPVWAKRNFSVKLSVQSR
jgi:hypothetical protein